MLGEPARHREHRGRRGHRVLIARPEEEAPSSASPSTRERILDAALDRFTEKGFDATSLREIAEELGVTKAALYYHFQSKEDILLALHLRVHHLFAEALGRAGGDLTSMQDWATFLDGCIVTMLDNRRLLIMHERNRAAFETLHRKDHGGNEEPFERFTSLLRSSELSLRERARLAASLGALIGGATIVGLGSETSLVEVAEILREVVRDILRPAPPGDRG